MIHHYTVFESLRRTYISPCSVEGKVEMLYDSCSMGQGEVEQEAGNRRQEILNF